MQKLEGVTEEQKKFAIDLLITLVVKEISDKLDIEPSKELNEFIASETGKLLYDESSKLWWNGPSYIANMYLEEKGTNEQ